ncbi:uncharacterized protein LOC115886584 [Sitophilus oryzae]|uniref:Uncharacterized protein LOC115886584 n=1 Tax=Sitophilus oryzae TaxID=7048 RepID=A0A6J2YE51_SITOR|nr:uncharacterized protein LOC115886584 [Sitophilus oryzae]
MMLIVAVLVAALCLVYAQEDQSSSRINNPRSKVPMAQNSENLRCFCNLPRCVATGYLCKSDMGGCFSNFVDFKKSAGHHGCIEFLTAPDRNICLLKQEYPAAEVKPLLNCCSSDLCNHVDSPVAKNIPNNTFAEEDSVGKQQQNNQEQMMYTDTNIWFRVATIAVPICGAIILFVLIALAVKILKNENRNSLQNKLSGGMYGVMLTKRKDRGTSKQSQYPSRNPLYSQAFHDSRQEDLRNEAPVQVPLLIVKNEIKTSRRPPGPVNESTKNDTNSKLDKESRQINSSNNIVLVIEKERLDYETSHNIVENSKEKCCGTEKEFLA